MQFSWKLLNIFINLKTINFKTFQEKLILSGIEINKVEYNNEHNDKIIDISITTNRKEICSTLNLAIEISNIFHIPIKILNIKLVEHSKIKSTQNINNQKLPDDIWYYRINHITYLKTFETPLWIIENLRINNINIQDNLIDNISSYIKIKWGQVFHSVDIKDLNKFLKRLQIPSYEKNKWQINEKRNGKVLIFIIYNTKLKKNIFNSIEFFENAYIDTMKIISTFTKCSISKAYSQYNYNNLKKIYSKIKIDKNEINTLLGQVKYKKLQFLSTKNILKIFRQLKFFPIYQKREKAFIIKVPYIRYHDLKRKIDIIEEIGRINEFENFIEKLPKKKHRGKTFNNYLKVKKIRQALRNLGFNEVINCCLVNNGIKQDNEINLYNPLNKDEKELRQSTLENLIIGYKNNIKHQNEHIEIFEIGKVFQKSFSSKYIEKQYLGGLLSNPKFTRKKWSDKTDYANLFHVKGIFETFLEIINSNAYLQKINISTYNTNDLIYEDSSNNLFSKYQKIGIYNPLNDILIGIIGRVSLNYTKKINLSKTNAINVYIFELNLNELNKTINKNYHLYYSIKEYSKYPSVTRDISIKIHYKNSVNSIIDKILKIDHKLIESIEIFNEYYEKDSSIKSIGLRITYRAKNRTLNSKDIINIDYNIKKLLAII
uniref:phenylalanine--tRNA ligase n=1 Tax=Kuetzingia canaliculata TaxID=228262 RepID=A0A1Z1MQ32_KUECA|nr:Phenylalanine-tRNA ligase beta subunit [Kuetzingia canaliculata]ARW67969.1 Phenylalanine-tRNA ligase beta subunit [Kuetzingia canaliculata]